MVTAAHVSPGRPRDPGVDSKIAQAALDLFGEAGWAGFAMETVARRAEPVAFRVTCHKSRLYHSGAVAQRLHEALEEGPVPRLDGLGVGSRPPAALDGVAHGSSGSTLTSVALWLLPTHNCDGVTDLSTSTRRMLVSDGRR